MASKISIITSMLIVLTLMITLETQVTKAVECYPGPLVTACYFAIKVPAIKPTAECCKAQRELESCFCEISKSRFFAWVVDSPGARKCQTFCSINFDPDRCN